MNSQLLGETFVVVVGVLIVTYLCRCYFLIRAYESRGELRRLQEHLQGDVASKVASGHHLDWAYFSEKAYRGLENIREHLRNYGTISLATGVAGTMGALASHLLTTPEMGDGTTKEMGLALVASGIGVFGNLVILWGLLPLANRRFESELDLFVTGMRKQEADLRAKTGTVDRVAVVEKDRIAADRLLDVMVRLPNAFDRVDDIVGDFGKDINRFYDGVARWASFSEALAESAASIARMPVELDTVMATARQAWSVDVDSIWKDLDAWETERTAQVVELRKTIDNVVEAVGSVHVGVGEKIDAAVQSMARSLENVPNEMMAMVERSAASIMQEVNDVIGAQLASVGEGISNGLNQMRSWQKKMNSNLNDARKQYDRAMHNVVTMTNDVVSRLQGMPMEFAEELEKSSHKLGREFGHEARQHVVQLERILREDATERQKKRELHESNLLNTTVRELQKVSEQILNKTVRDLEDVSRRFGKVLQMFPDQVAAVNTRLADAESEMTGMVIGIEQMSAGVVTAHNATADMVARLGETTEDLVNVVAGLKRAVERRKDGRWTQMRRLLRRKWAHSDRKMPDEQRRVVR